MTESIIFSLDSRTDFLNKIVDSFYQNIKTERISDSLHLGNVNVEKFADGEVSVDFKDSVRGKRVYLVSSPNTSDKLMQLNLAIDSAKRASASSIVVILPCYPYQRSDKKDASRGPIGAKVVAEMLETRGANSIITYDLHNPSIEGFFNIPVTHMEGKFVFEPYIVNLMLEKSNLVLAAPDAGASKRIKKMRDYIFKETGTSLPIVILDKIRVEANKVDSMTLIGDVKNKTVVIYDDMADTMGTILKAAEVLKDNGAEFVYAMASHGLLSNNAADKLKANRFLDGAVFSDSLEIDIKESKKIKIMTCTDIIAKSIIAINNSKSYESILKH